VAHSIQIDESLVRALVAAQFPEWAELPIQGVAESGWDNRSFRLGSKMVIRLPSAPEYEKQVHREHRWLPYLRSRVLLPIPEPLALGRPGHGFPLAWSVYRWLDGATAASTPPSDPAEFAEDLALFLNALRAIPAEEGPTPGPDNFHRGAALHVYDKQLREAISVLAGQIDEAAALAAWESALATPWSDPPVWVHGDIALGNLLVNNGKLAAVIDFGQLCAGDPACDLAIAWTYFRGLHRRTFRERLALDAATWQRGRAWALWKAAIVSSGLTQTNAVESRSCMSTLSEILYELAQTEA
jgi:aminoglycoside phosphotransferase (APT) family kinase protein